MKPPRPTTSSCLMGGGSRGRSGRSSQRRTGLEPRGLLFLGANRGGALRDFGIGAVIVREGFLDRGDEHVGRGAFDDVVEEAGGRAVLVVLGFVIGRVGDGADRLRFPESL